MKQFNPQDFMELQKKYNYLEQIHIKRTIDVYDISNFNVEIILIDIPNCETDNKLKLSFWGVKDFKLNNIDNLFRLHIAICDVRKNQLENINYKVIEDENCLFEFACNDINFEIVKD